MWYIVVYMENVLLLSVLTVEINEEQWLHELCF
jgi:hypothetical protein